MHLLLQTTQLVVQPSFPQWLIPLLGPVLVSVVSDLQGYASARKTNPDSKFDFVLFGTRLLIGLVTGILSALGQSAISTPVQ